MIQNAKVGPLLEHSKATSTAAEARSDTGRSFRCGLAAEIGPSGTVGFRGVERTNLPRQKAICQEVSSRFR